MKKATFLFVGASLLMLACSDGPGSGAGAGLGSSGIPSNGSIPGPGTVPGGGTNTGSNTGGSGNVGNTGGSGNDGGTGNVGNSGGTGGGDCLSSCNSLATECGFASDQCGAFCSQLSASQISCIQETGCTAITDTTNDPCGLFGGSGGTGGGTGGTGGGGTTCSTADECAGCTACLDACYCQAELTGFDPTICPSSCGG